MSYDDSCTDGSGDMPSAYTIDDLAEGDVFDVEATVSETDIDRFADVTGDRSPLHMDGAFASARGFQGRVVHGLFLGGLVSRVVGMHFPGERALLQSVSLNFLSPAYAGMTVRIRATVDQVSHSVRTVVLKIAVDDVATQTLLARGKVQVGFTGD